MKRSPALRIPAILILVALFLLPAMLLGQESKEKKNREFWHRVTVGGNIGLEFGTVTAINVSPEAMVRAVDQLHVGLGFSYDYVNARNYFWNDNTGDYIDFTSNAYGGRIFLRYYLKSLFENALGNIFAHTEYEFIYYTRPYKAVPYITAITDPYGNYFRKGTDAIQINDLYVGAGYDQPLGDRVSMDIVILYNLNETVYSLYSNPLFRLGFRVRL